MNAFIDALSKRLGEWWPVTLVATGLPHVIVTLCALLAGNGHMFDLSYLVDRSAEEIQHRTVTPAAATAAAALLLLGSIAAALTAGILSRGTQQLWLGSWPFGLRWLERRRIARRRASWDSLAALHTQASIRAEETRLERDTARARDLGRRRNRISLAPPTRATWMGDRLAAVTARVRERYDLDLEFGWPRLLLMINQQERTELAAARTRIDQATILVGWGLLYFVLGVGWWLPALAIGVVLILVAWRRSGSAVDCLAHLLEATVDLHAGEMAVRVGLIAESDRLDRATGTQLTRLLRKNA